MNTHHSIVKQQQQNSFSAAAKYEFTFLFVLLICYNSLIRPWLYDFWKSLDYVVGFACSFILFLCCFKNRRVLILCVQHCYAINTLGLLFSTKFCFLLSTNLLLLTCIVLRNATLLPTMLFYHQPAYTTTICYLYSCNNYFLVLIQTTDSLFTFEHIVHD